MPLSSVSRLLLALSFLGVVIALEAPMAHGQAPTGSERVIEVEPRYTATPQPIDKRQWAEVDLEKRFSVSEGDDYLLYGAWEVDSDSMGNVYVLDKEDRRVKKFDAEGNFVRAIGAGRGPGPAQFEWPMDVAVTDAGAVWIIDSHRRKLSRFAPGGSFAKSFQLDGTSAPKSIALTNEGNAIVLAHGSAPLFRKWSPDGTLKSKFGTLVKNQDLAFMALDGMIRPGRRGFVFAPNRASHLLRFNADSTLRYAVQTMDDVPYPEAHYSTGDYRTVGIEPVRRFSTLDVSVVDGKIYCYSAPASSSETRVIDVYRYADGRYLYSFKLPIVFKKFGLTENHLMELTPVQLTVWRWVVGTSP